MYRLNTPQFFTLALSMAWLFIELELYYNYSSNVDEFLLLSSQLGSMLAPLAIITAIYTWQKAEDHKSFELSIEIDKIFKSSENMIYAIRKELQAHISQAQMIAGIHAEIDLKDTGMGEYYQFLINHYTKPERSAYTALLGIDIIHSQIPSDLFRHIVSYYSSICDDVQLSYYPKATLKNFNQQDSIDSINELLGLFEQRKEYARLIIDYIDSTYTFED